MPFDKTSKKLTNVVKILKHTAHFKNNISIKILNKLINNKLILLPTILH